MTCSLWVAVSMQAPVSSELALRYEVLVASNDHSQARREGGRKAAELGADCYAVTRLVALGFGEGALELPSTPGRVEVVLRSELQNPGDARVHASLGPVAVVPTKDDVAAFIAECDDAGPRVIYFSSSCPLQLSWMH